MTRDTSIAAYNEIKKSGLLRGLKLEVYDLLFQKGPLTAKNVDLLLKKPTQSTGVYTTRLSELEKEGVVARVGKTICSITGREVYLWDVTSNVPIKFEKPKRHKCKHCDGKGYTEEQQARLF